MPCGGFGALFRIEKFSLTVEQFQGVPLLGVVAGGEDDASVGLVVDTIISTVGVVDSPRSITSMPIPEQGGGN